MSDENKGVSGPASLRIGHRKVSELPFGLGEQAKQQMPAFIEEQRRNKVDAILARFPRGNVGYFEARIAECQANLVRFAAAKEDCLKRMDDYQGLLRNNEGRPHEEVDEEIAELGRVFVAEHGHDPSLVANGRPVPGTVPFQQLREQIKALNAQKIPYEDEALWEQIKKFQEERDRYDEVAKVESESILELKGAFQLVHQRVSLAKQALEEPIAVE